MAWSICRSIGTGVPAGKVVLQSVMPPCFNIGFGGALALNGSEGAGRGCEYMP